MSKRGPKVDGVKTTKKGYIRRYFVEHDGYRMEHDVVWESVNGPIPEGHDIHHVNGVKTDNRLENLELLTKLEHKRLHSGCYRDIKGDWIKPCRRCNVFQEIEANYYKRPDGISPWCKSCSIENAVRIKKERRSKNK